MFKSISIAIIAAAIALGGAAVEAKKLGGGKSVGTQRSAPAASPAAAPTAGAPAAAATAAPAAAAAAAPKTGMAKWAGPLAGIAAGLGLGYLFSQLGGGAASMLMMVLLAGLVIGGLFFAIRMFMRKQNPAMASPSGAAPSPFGAPQQRTEPTAFTGTGAMGGAAAPLAAAAVGGNFGIPADFDKAGFEANAKSQFMALQAANDKGDLDAVREFATDTFYNEIAKDVIAGNKDATVVESLHAELLGIETDRGQYWASVQFTGKMREDGMVMASDFREVWNLTKPVDGSKGWLLAGIQQA
jgi:predicted lipid-binding transport protein (Tim44 family)